MEFLNSEFTEKSQKEKKDNSFTYHVLFYIQNVATILRKVELKDFTTLIDLVKAQDYALYVET